MTPKKLVIYLCIFATLVLLSMFIFNPLIKLGKYDTRYIYATEAYGYSMLPNIHSGDLLIVAKKDSPYFNPEPYDVLVYIYNDNIVVAHRLIKVQEDYYICKGDNNPYCEVVSKDRVIGEVVEVIPSDNIIAIALAKYFISQNN